MAVLILKELFENERSYLNHFFDHLNYEEVDKVLTALHNCKGMIVLTGVGKSGLVAEKIAMTMTSTGTRALFLSPTNALHGDIGIINKGDVFVILSKSGESNEVLSLIPYARNKGATIVAIVSVPNCRMSKAVDIPLILPSEKELCPFDMAPTTSTIIQMIVGDALAIALMKIKNISMEDYILSHPGGKIGKRISLKVKDLMLTREKIPLCKPEDKLVDTLVELSNKQCGCVLIVDGSKKLLGIFTDGDLRRALQNKGVQALDFEMQNLMIKTPRFIEAEVLAWQALEKMEADQKHPIMVLPVVEEDKVIGIIKMHDIVQSGVGS
jgi:arabinose-5-phosphate isomerase